MFETTHQVDIGWKDFVITEAVSTQGCLDDWEGRVNIGSPFGTGYYAKSTVRMDRYNHVDIWDEATVDSIDMY